MSDLITQMRSHVASYKALSPHRQCCLDMCDEIERLTSDVKFWRDNCKEHAQVRGQQTDEIERLTAALSKYGDHESDLIERWSKCQHGDVIGDRFIVQDTIKHIIKLETVCGKYRCLAHNRREPCARCEQDALD